MAARLMPRMRFTVSVAPVRSAPVLPAETTASPLPSRSIASATAMDESFLRRVAVLGSSSMLIISLAFTISISPSAQPSFLRQVLTLSSMPTRVISTPSSLLALTAPRTISSGALSPPIASTIILTVKNLLRHKPVDNSERALGYRGILISLALDLIAEGSDYTKVYIHGLEIADAAAGDI